MRLIYVAAMSVLLDLLLGDPEQLVHPVVLMGRCITLLEKSLRRIFPQTPRGQLAAGGILAILMPTGTLLLCTLLVRGLYALHPAAGFLLEVIWGWQALAIRDLRRESTNVYKKLKNDTLEEARRAVSRIVGRDTWNLTAEGVTKAAIETVAESFSDGIVAPMCYLFLGGAPLAMCYKSINTMDSMVGYKNEKYLFFGRCAARLDDLANYIPSRLAALFLIAAAGLCRGTAVNAIRIWRRDRRRHASPNSAQTEAVMAGALGVQLAGPACYFGEYYDKPTIGDPDRPVTVEDILSANRMMLTGSLLALIALSVLRVLCVNLCGL